MLIFRCSDYFVIGGGSGGLASAVSDRNDLATLNLGETSNGACMAIVADWVQRRASQHGAKVGVIEATHRLGGTCVNVG